MLSLHDGSDPTEMGTQIEFPEDLTAENHEKLTDLMSNVLAPVLLADFGCGQCGHLLIFTAEEAANFGLPAQETPVVYWYNADDPDSDTDLRKLTLDEAARLTTESDSMCVDRIIAHYRAKPEDDGHPAYNLYKVWKKRNDRSKNLPAPEPANE